MAQSQLYKFKAKIMIENKEYNIRSIIRLTKSYLLNKKKRVKFHICDWASIKSSQVLSLKIKKVKNGGK